MRRWLLLLMLLPLGLCAQTPCNDTVVRFRDTICEGDSYLFFGRHLTHSGVYYDTLPRHQGGCDSAVILTLEVLPPASVTFFTYNYCRGEVGYKIMLGCEGSYFRWSADPPDADLESQSDRRLIHVNPQQPTTYYVFADYGEQRRCPDSGKVFITPLVPVKASLYVSPAEVDIDHLELTLADQSVGNKEVVWGYCGREWYLAGEQLARWGAQETVKLLMPPGDSLRVKLVAYNYVCADSAVAVLPVRREGIYFPNVFRPVMGEGGSVHDCSLFAPVTVGIVECEVWIYDRRGSLVFHTFDARQGWNGRCRDVTCPQGTYVYRCRYRTAAQPNSDQVLKGTLLLLR